MQPGEVIDDPKKSVISLNPDSFLVIKESETRHIENLVDHSGDEYYISRLVLSKVTPADAGMYICVVTDHEEGKSTFKYAYLQVKEGIHHFFVCIFIFGNLGDPGDLGFLYEAGDQRFEFLLSCFLSNCKMNLCIFSLLQPNYNTYNSF